MRTRTYGYDASAFVRRVRTLTDTGTLLEYQRDRPYRQHREEEEEEVERAQEEQQQQQEMQQDIPPNTRPIPAISSMTRLSSARSLIGFESGVTPLTGVQSPPSSDGKTDAP